MIKVTLLKDVPWLGKKGRKGMEISISKGSKPSMASNGYIAKDVAEAPKEVPVVEVKHDEPVEAAPVVENEAVVEEPAPIAEEPEAEEAPIEDEPPVEDEPAEEEPVEDEPEIVIEQPKKKKKK